MNFLSQIIEKKRARLTEAQTATPLEELRERIDAADRRSPNALRSALSCQNRVNIIAEFKRRSPSKGVIRAGADPQLIARSYESGGAVAISVLTEQDYFDGSLQDLRSVATSVTIPILRKDFIFDEYQVYESVANGANAILLIVAGLEDDRLRYLRELAEDRLQIDALVEVHTESEMRRAIDSGASLIGVNNRDLSTFEVSLETSIRLAAIAPKHLVLVSESGLNTTADLRRLRAVGYQGFLIGESLMRSDDPAEMLRGFLD